MPEVKKFMDVIVLPTGNQYRISYRTGMTVYEELFADGLFVSQGWNGAGYPLSVKTLPEIKGLKAAQYAEPQAFQLEIDGQSLGSHWEWAGIEQLEEVRGLHVIVKLRHTIRPVHVNVHSLLDGTPILTRWLEIVNTSDQPSALGAVYPWSGGLQSTTQWKAYMENGDSLYSVGYMEDTRYLNEGDFHWHSLPNATYAINGRYLGDRYRHPMFVLRNEATGEHFIGQLAWAGGYTFSFDLNCDIGDRDMGAYLSFKAGISAPAPLRMLEAAETVKTPEMHMGMLFGGLDDCIQAMHEHVRETVFTIPKARGRDGWVEAIIWCEVIMSEEATYHQIETAAYLGAEVFFIDAGWYTPPFGEWHWGKRLGDWVVNPDRYPGGLKPIRDAVREKGMLFGLWMEPERFGEASDAIREHPDWLAVPYDGEANQGRLRGMLDLGKPEAARWVEEQITWLIEEHELDFFRLDYNTKDTQAGSYTLKHGYIENSYWRYYEHFDAIFGNLRKKFPDVIFENCASGGGRTDLASVRNFSHTWVTDNQAAPRSFSITNGMTMALPPEYVDRFVAGQGGHTAAEIQFQTRQQLFGRPTIGMFHPLGSDKNPIQLSYVRHTLDLYKNFVRPFMSTCKIYHHTPELKGFEPRGWGILELASNDKTRGIAGIFQLVNPKESETVLRLRGLDRSRKYKVTWDNSGQTYEIDGYLLMNQGLVIRLEGALTSELLLFEAI